MKEKLEIEAEKIASDYSYDGILFDIGSSELESIFKSGAKWMLEQLKADPAMISRELISKYLDELK